MYLYECNQFFDLMYKTTTFFNRECFVAFHRGDGFKVKPKTIKADKETQTEKQRSEQEHSPMKTSKPVTRLRKKSRK